MAREKDIKKWQAHLDSTLPLLGAGRRRRAMDALELNRGDPDVVPLLVHALGAQNDELASWALDVLGTLESRESVDALCALWLEERDERLGAIVSANGYVASEPPALHVFSGLKAGAIEELKQAGKEAVQHLVEALTDPDSAIRKNTLVVLSRLTNPIGVDALCALWAEQRSQVLEGIILSQGYVARTPFSLHLLTALKTGKQSAVDSADAIPILVGFLKDPDETVRRGAENLLEHLPNRSLVDALCEKAIKDPAGPGAKLCIRTGARPSDHERACLFLFVTRQLDAYFAEDFEFQNLRLQYDRADPATRAHVMDVVRSGDRRCAGFFGTRSKPLRECTDAEIKLALDSWLRHQEWPRLFKAFLELPLKYGLPALTSLSGSGWEPEVPDLQSVFRQVLADVPSDIHPAPSRGPAPASSLFEKWLDGGKEPEWARLNTDELVRRLESAPPPEGVSAVAALAARGVTDMAAIQAVRNSPHWLVRLAGHACGLYPPDLILDAGQDSNYWITELASAKGVLDFWPGEATPADLERLSQAPPEAWVGKLGAARKVLRTIMTHRITTGTFEAMVVEAAEFAGEFVEAADVEWVSGDH